ncbi:MAG: CzcE family metal-binding protein [Ramlibacter sp.]|nr:CzcE family metal-binding protein [Ramlibacter sp.]
MKQRSLSLAALGLFAAMAAHAAVPTRLLGDVVSPTEASRTIRIDPATRYVNVYRGETIRFLANGQQFGYFFDGAPGEASFDLRQVAPPGTLDHRVVAYISRDPYNRWAP